MANRIESVLYDCCCVVGNTLTKYFNFSFIFIKCYIVKYAYTWKRTVKALWSRNCPKWTRVSIIAKRLSSDVVNSWISRKSRTSNISIVQQLIENFKLFYLIHRYVMQPKAIICIAIGWNLLGYRITCTHSNWQSSSRFSVSTIRCKCDDGVFMLSPQSTLQYLRNW